VKALGYNPCPCHPRQKIFPSAKVALGIGTLACSITSDARLTFYEIDGVVEEIARDQRYFHYLEDCGDRRDVVTGAWGWRRSPMARSV
jgi:hypothetical protein